MVTTVPYAMSEQVLVLSADHRGRVYVECVGTQEAPSVWTSDLYKVIELVWGLGIGNGNQTRNLGVCVCVSAHA